MPYDCLLSGLNFNELLMSSGEKKLRIIREEEEKCQDIQWIFKR